jgi:mRNA interferase YafQ
MLNSSYTTQFKRDYKLQLKRHRNLDLLDKIIIALVNEEKLPDHHKDHKLQGDYGECRECHITPDWLLIYKIEKNEIYFVRTGTHSDLF